MHGKGKRHGRWEDPGGGRGVRPGEMEKQRRHVRKKRKRKSGKGKRKMDGGERGE